MQQITSPKGNALEKNKYELGDVIWRNIDNNYLAQRTWVSNINKQVEIIPNGKNQTYHSSEHKKSLQSAKSMSLTPG